MSWDETCPTSAMKVATLPAGPTGTTTGVPVLVRGAAVPTMWTIHETNNPYEEVDVIVGRLSGGAWSWHTQPLDITVDERLGGFVAAPDGSLVAPDLRGSTTMQGQTDVRLARDVAGTFTFTSIQTTRLDSSLIGVDRNGTAHLLYNAPPVSSTGSKLVHVQVSSTGQITGPDPLWAGGLLREFTAPDGDVYGLDGNRLLLVHLGP